MSTSYDPVIRSKSAAMTPFKFSSLFLVFLIPMSSSEGLLRDIIFHINNQIFFFWLRKEYIVVEVGVWGIR